MSTNKSAHLNLHLWEPEDDFLRTEFNENFEKIDAGVRETAEAKPYVVGTYTGTGKAMTITLGFRPSFLILSGSQTTAQTKRDYLGAYDLITGGRALSDAVTFTDTGFELNMLGSNQYPQLVASNHAYDYIEFQ